MSGPSTCWFAATSDDELASAIVAHVALLEERDSTQRAKDEIHAVLYANRHAFTGAFARSLTLMQSGGNTPLKLNVTRSMIDTVTARIAQDFPLVEVAADDAEWSYKLRARRMTRFITTKQEETGFRRIAPLVFRDACIRGTGIIKVTSEHGEIVHERIPKKELFIDPLEARYGTPRSIHQRKQYSREVLAAMFPDHAEAIANAPQAKARDDEQGLEEFDRSNLVDVWESYHLRSSPEAKDGLHAITMGPLVLLREEWTRPRLPFAFLHWSPPDDGFWGTGLAEELAPVQWSIDRTVGVLEEGFRLGAPLRVFLQRNSKIVKTQLIARVGTIVECSGPAPEIKAPSNPVSQQQINWLTQCYEWAYQIAGVSQMAAAAKKPGGIESGEGLRVFHDFETERFQHVEAAYQNLALDCAELEIDEAKAIYTAKGEDGKPLYKGFHARWVHRDVVEKIDWADVDLDRDKFKLKLKPVNFFTGSKTAQLERAQMLAQGGLVPQRWLLPLFEAPDLARFMRLETAMFNFCEWTVEQLMDDRAQMPQPDSIADLEMLVEHVKAGYLDSVVDGAPEAVRKRFRNYLTSATAKQTKAKAAVAPPLAMAPGAGGMPPAGPLPPGPAPTTLPGAALPNAPGAMAA